MKKATLQFQTILELLDFELLLKTEGHQIDRGHFIISGYFEEADIELAKAGYKATVIEEDVTRYG